jgi:glycosylphosphatidylinositol transamidase (GPIT) subunit GPI8
VKTEKGYIKNYVRLTSGVLSSLEQNDFDVSNVIVKDIRIRIFNQDNQPLDISEEEVSGNVHEVIARFTEDADYFFSYGNEEAYRPSYDINHFTNTIPKDLKTVTLDEELSINQIDSSGETDAEEEMNKSWLWAIMAVIIIVLGWFTFKMMRSEGQSKEE